MGLCVACVGSEGTGLRVAIGLAKTRVMVVCFIVITIFILSFFFFFLVFSCYRFNFLIFSLFFLFTPYFLFAVFQYKGERGLKMK